MLIVTIPDTKLRRPTVMVSAVEPGTVFSWDSGSYRTYALRTPTGYVTLKGSCPMQHFQDSTALFIDYQEHPDAELIVRR